MLYRCIFHLEQCFKQVFVLNGWVFLVKCQLLCLLYNLSCLNREIIQVHIIQMLQGEQQIRNQIPINENLS